MARCAATDELRQLHHAMAERVVQEMAITSDQLDFSAAEIVPCSGRRRIVYVIKEIGYGLGNDLCRGIELARADSILTGFVFLHGLKCKAEPVAKLCLADPGKLSRQT